MLKNTWVVTANGWLARIFKVEKNHSLSEIATFIHPQARKYDHQLVSDRPGRSYESVQSSSTRHAMEPPMTPKETEKISFAQQVCKHLEHARTGGEYEQLYVAASPEFLGLLRQHFTRHCRDMVAEEVHKDITDLKPEQIRSYWPILQ